MIQRSEENAFVGMGKRDPLTTSGQVDVLIVQSWMLGHQAYENSQECLSVNKCLGVINQNLIRYSEWEQLFDALMIIGADDVGLFKKWKDRHE